MTTENVTSDAPVEQTSAAPQENGLLNNAPAPEPAQVEQQTQQPAAQQQEQEDYSWVPKFYLKEGKPDFKGLATAYDELNKKFSSGVRGAFAPKDISEYEWTPPDGMEITEDDEATMVDFKAELQKHNVSKEAYGFLMNRHAELLMHHTEQVLDHVLSTPEKTAAILREEWGEHFDVGIKNAKTAFRTIMPGHDPNDPIMNHPTVMKMLAQIGATLGEDSAPSDSKMGGTPTMSPDEVRKLMESPEYYSDREIQAKVTKFFEQGGRI